MTTEQAPAARRAVAPAAMTLIEMLVAMTLTLIMMGAVAQIFGMLGEGVNNSRSSTELGERMRAVAYRLKQDLSGVSADLAVVGRPELARGYFEIVEGPNSDSRCFYNGVNPPTPFYKSVTDDDPSLTLYRNVVGGDDRLAGDTDDILMFTTRNDTADFRGKLGPVGIRSAYAEVIWYCTQTPNTADPVAFTLHRRQRIVKSHPGAGEFVNGNRRAFSSWAELHRYTDVSCRVEDGFARPNSLGDLTKRENRFLHAANFPHAFDPAALATMLAEEAASDRFGDDTILTNVIGFDVRVFDPGAPIQVPSTAATVVPGDPGYVPGGPFPSTGAYVDLGYSDSGLPPHTNSSFDQPLFHHFGEPKSRLTATLTTPRTFCTWSSHYETDALDQDGVLGPDQGANGRDDNGNVRIDEIDEAETLPPYLLALRGIEIRIRCYEPASRQVKQLTVRQAF
jgi:hypothetical protein